MGAVYGKESKERRQVGSIHVMEGKSISCREWRVVKGFSVGQFCGLICVLEQLFWQ